MSHLELDTRLSAAALGASGARPLGFSSLQGGLYATLRALGVGPGSEVLCDPLFPFAALAVLHAGGRPRTPILDEYSVAATPAAWRTAWVPGVDVIVATAAFGADAGVSQLGLEVAVVLDRAHSVPSAIDMEAFAAVGFSFARGKPIDAGEGGLVLFASDDLRDRAHAWSCFGVLPDGAVLPGTPGLNLRPHPALPALVARARVRLEELLPAATAAGADLSAQLEPLGARRLLAGDEGWLHPFLSAPASALPDRLEAGGLAWRRCALKGTGAALAHSESTRARLRAQAVADRLHWYRPLLPPIWEEK